MELSIHHQFNQSFCSMYLRLLLGLYLTFQVLNTSNAQFSNGHQDHEVPELDESFDDQLYGDYSNYGLLDMNGDGLVDLVDCESATGQVHSLNGQKYWKVYINSGVQFSTTAQQWVLPDLGEIDDDQLYGEFSNYSVIDVNGDDLPDLIDAEDNTTGGIWINGSQRYWKVYLNGGSGFQSNPIIWHIPDLGESYDDQVYGDYSNFGLSDLNGDGMLDLVDAEDNASGDVWMTGNQRYWNVYLNTGNSFSNISQSWHIPDLGETYQDQLYGDYSNYSLMDINGDGRADLIDAEDNTSGLVWMNGGQRYWRVFLNNGIAFQSTAIQWSIPDLGEQFDDQLYGDNSNYGLQDMNGDGKLDLIDAEDNTTGLVWMNGGQRYWKVYINTGSSFQSSFIQWDIPDLGEQFDDQLYGDNGHFGIYDFTGDGVMDLIDSEDNVTGAIWQAGNNKYWRVYSGNSSLSTTELRQTMDSISVYPNPTHRVVTIELENKNQTIIVQVMDVAGRLLIEEEMTEWSHQLNLPEHSGMYLIQVTDQKGNRNSLFVQRL